MTDSSKASTRKHYFYAEDLDAPEKFYMFYKKKNRDHWVDQNPTTRSATTVIRNNKLMRLLRKAKSVNSDQKLFNEFIVGD